MFGERGLRVMPRGGRRCTVGLLFVAMALGCAQERREAVVIEAIQPEVLDIVRPIDASIEAIYQTPLSFFVPYHVHAVSWERAEHFFRKELACDRGEKPWGRAGTQGGATTTGKGQKQLSGLDCRTRVRFMVTSEMGPKGVAYRVVGLPERGGSGTTDAERARRERRARFFAQNLARFIRDGVLEREILVGVGEEVFGDSVAPNAP